MEWVAIKSGWLYERKHGLVVARSKRREPRWVVIYGQPVPALGVYEQRSDAIPPYAPLRHLDLPSDTLISCPDAPRKKSIFGFLGLGSKDVPSSRASSIADLKIEDSSSSEKACSFSIIRRGQNSTKICFLASSHSERDEWVDALRGVLNTTMPSEPALTTPVPLAPTTSRMEQYDSETISCGGVVIMDGRTVARIKAGASCNPLSLCNGSISNDSIVGEMTESKAILSDSLVELDELNYRYQQAVADRFKAEKARDIMRLELQIYKLVGQFHDCVTQRLKRIVNDYHCGKGVGTRFEEGPLRILFITDYSQAEEEIINGAYAWLRQEMNAARWVSRKLKPMLHQSLMTVCEFKGFRALAMLALPFGEGPTLLMEPEVGLVDETAMNTLKTLASEMNLLSSHPYRLADGRILQLALPSSVEVHKLDRSTKKTEKPNLKGTFAKTPAGYYLANVHDIVPAYPATENLRGFLYFRPEFIESLSAPVTPGDLHPESKTSLLKVLRDTCLPQFLERLEELHFVPLDSEEWRTTLHEAGLNVALLGAIARDTKLPHIREGAVIEMVARTTKIILRSRVRGAILHFREVQALRVEEELKSIVLEIINGVITSSSLWMEEIMSLVEDRFGYSVEVEFYQNLSRNALLMALQHHCALEFDDAIYAKQGVIGPEDFKGFTMQLTDGGSGCFSGSKLGSESVNNLVQMAKIILPAGESLWAMNGRRAAASRAILKVVDQHIINREWDDAMRHAELASGMSSRQHPQQIRISLAIITIRTLGPANLAWRPPTLGEKPSSATTRDELVFEELLKSKNALIFRVDRHFGPHHPLGIQLRLKLAELMESVKGGCSEALKIRTEALNISNKVLGRRHGYSRALLTRLANAHYQCGNYDDAITAYSEAIKLLSVVSEDEEGAAVVKAEVLSGMSKCWQAKGDFEISLEYSSQCRTHLEQNLPHHLLLEQTYEQLAELSQSIYSMASDKTSPSPLTALLHEELIAEPIVEHLETAVDCYSRLFDARRQRNDLNTEDGEELLRLARKIVLLVLRLASPPQRPAIRALVRKRLFQRSSAGDLSVREAQVRELLVRMASGPCTPQELVERVLQTAENVETLPEAESELALMLDLIELVQ